MAKELAFVLINPYPIRKSRTGGLISRFISRTQLDLVGASMFGPSKELAEKYAELVRVAPCSDAAESNDLIADYILNNYAPDPETGRVHRVMLLLFEGEDAVNKVWEVTGSSTLRWGRGETIRDTFGDYIVDAEGKVTYFEPAVLVGPTKKRVAATLKLWSQYAETDAGIISTSLDAQEGDNLEKTLVLIKPDNFRFRSGRPGNIIDVLSTSGLRIVGAKKFRMTVAQAEEFYGPVRENLKDKFKFIAGERAASLLSNEFGFTIPVEPVREFCDKVGGGFAESQFESIVKYMTGYRPSECSESEKQVLGMEDCLALVYEGVNAVSIIRNILGPTDPSKAKPGSVRREFGSNIMVNAAHASDSTDNAEREMGIIKITEDGITPHVDRKYGNIISKVMAIGSTVPERGCKLLRKVRTSPPELEDSETEKE